MKITTNNKCVLLDKLAIPKSSKEVSMQSFGVRLTSINKTQSIDIHVDNTTIDSVQAESPQQLFDYFLANGFQSSSKGGSDIVVDQTYSSTSNNAQSGVAVKQAIEPLEKKLNNNDATAYIPKSVIEINHGLNLTFWVGTQAEFDGLTTKPSNQLSIITP